MNFCEEYLGNWRVSISHCLFIVIDFGLVFQFFLYTKRDTFVSETHIFLQKEKTWRECEFHLRHFWHKGTCKTGLLLHLFVRNPEKSFARSSFFFFSLSWLMNVISSLSSSVQRNWWLPFLKLDSWSLPGKSSSSLCVWLSFKRLDIISTRNPIDFLALIVKSSFWREEMKNQSFSEYRSSSIHHYSVFDTLIQKWKDQKVITVFFSETRCKLDCNEVVIEWENQESLLDSLGWRTDCRRHLWRRFLKKIIATENGISLFIT